MLLFVSKVTFYSLIPKMSLLFGYLDLYLLSQINYCQIFLLLFPNYTRAIEQTQKAATYNSLTIRRIMLHNNISRIALATALQSPCSLLFPWFPPTKVAAVFMPKLLDPLS